MTNGGRVRCRLERFTQEKTNSKELHKQTRPFPFICRRVRSLSLEGCSLITRDGLESAIISWNELQSLKVKSCNNIKDCAPSSVFSSLKDLKWKPDSRSILSANLAGTGMGKKGYRIFKRSSDWKSLPGA